MAQPNRITFHEHPSYSRQKAAWYKYRDMLEADEAVMSSSGYLWMHQQEKMVSGAKDNDVRSLLYAIRSQRTQYFNINEIVLSLWISFLFRKAPQLSKDLEKDLGDEVNDIDGSKTSLFQFIKNFVAPDYLNYGKAVILADAPKERPKSRGEQERLKVRPYLERLSPLQLMDWDEETEESSRLGKFNLARYEYEVTPKRTSLTASPGLDLRTDILSLDGGRYTIKQFKAAKDTDGKYQSDADGFIWEAMGEGPLVSDLTEIPLAVTEDVSWVKDLCQEALRFHNLRSSKDSIEYNQSYQKNFIITDEKGENLSISEYIWNILPLNSSVQTVEPVNSASLATSVSESLDLCFKIGLNQLRSIPSGSKDVQSAQGQAAEKQNTFALAESALEDIENVINDAIRHYMAFKGKKDYQGKITLNKELSEESFEQFITVYQAFGDKLRGIPEVTEPVLNKVVQKLNLGKDAEALALKAISRLKDISAAPANEESDPILKALNGKNPTAGDIPADTSA